MNRSILLAVLAVVLLDLPARAGEGAPAASQTQDAAVTGTGSAAPAGATSTADHVIPAGVAPADATTPVKTSEGQGPEPAKSDAPAGGPEKPADSATAPAGAPADQASPSVAPASAGPAKAEKAEDKAPPPPPPKPTLAIDINLSSQRMTVSENGAGRYTWPISSARAGYKTPTGTFQPQWMSKMWYSRQYDLAPMPNAIFFTGGTAIHGTYATGQLGSPASHGCVRLAPGNAARLYKLVGQHGMELTRIVVHGSPPYRDAPYASAGRYSDRRYAGDPRRYRLAPPYYAYYGYGDPYGGPPAYYVKPRKAPKRGYSRGYGYFSPY